MTTEHPRIEFADIKIGDTVERWARGVVATIHVSTRTDEQVWNAEGGVLGDTAVCRWHLVERTAPELPTEPTWGWVHSDTPGELRIDFGMWCVRDDKLDQVRQGYSRPTATVTDFVPAALVPQVLIDDLRRLVNHAADTDRAVDGPLSMFLNVAGRFLQHVDQNAEQAR